MLISGIQPFTMLDYPEKTACIVFTPGCNFRCGYCHNPEFVLPEKIAELRNTFIPESAFFSFLNARRGMLDGVVVTGGEPTMMPDLITFMDTIKSLGFMVKLDTNGNRPEVVERALEHGVVDYIAIDVKTSLSGYRDLVGKFAVPENIAKSIALVKENGIAHEFRSTLVKEVHTPTVLEQMREMVAGSKMLYLQTFRPGTTLSPLFREMHPFSAEETRSIADSFRQVVEHVIIR